MLPRLLCGGCLAGSAAGRQVMLARAWGPARGRAGGSAAPAPGRCSMRAAAFVAADRPPAAVGDPLGAVDTPALVLDLDGAAGGRQRANVELGVGW